MADADTGPPGFAPLVPIGPSLFVIVLRCDGVQLGRAPYTLAVHGLWCVSNVWPYIGARYEDIAGLLNAFGKLNAQDRQAKERVWRKRGDR